MALDRVILDADLTIGMLLRLTAMRQICMSA